MGRDESVLLEMLIRVVPVPVENEITIAALTVNGNEEDCIIVMRGPRGELQGFVDSKPKLEIAGVAEGGVQ